MKKIITIVISFLLIPFASINGSNIHTSGMSNNGILYVGGNGPNNYTSIQEAINNAEDGCIIYVYPGNYNESIVINKSISLIGIEKNGEKPVINGSENGRKKVVTIEGNDIIFKNFAVMYGRGVILKNSSDCMIENNEIIRAKPRIDSSIYGALEIHNSTGCEIINNSIERSKGEGMAIWKSSVKAIYNKISHNYDEGLYITDSYNSIISYNELTKNLDGIDADWSKNSIISHNKIYYNDQYGIITYDSSHLSILNNTIYHHSYGGIMHIGDNSTFSGNEIYDNGWGISLETDVGILINKNIDNVVSRNNVYSNGVGIYIEDTRKNYITENNLIDNYVNAYFWHSISIEEIERPHPPRPIHNTWYRNYWSDWNLSIPKPIKGRLTLAWCPYYVHLP